jgi:outer membrane protein OmpU
MNNLKKIGLTALGTALVTAGSAQAAALSVSASTSINFGGEDNSDKGNGWTMTDSISFSGSGEMDNGFTVSTSFELDNGALDDREISIDTGTMGKLTFVGSGNSGPISAWDDITPTANEEAHGVATAGTASGAANAASSKDIFVYDYTIMDGLALKASYTPSDTTVAIESSMDYGLLYTGIEGLSVYAAMGENNNQPTAGITGKADLTMFGVKYAMGAMTIGYQVNETDSGEASQDEDFTAMGISYAVSDDLSVSLNSSTIDFESSASDQEATGVSFSYTSGGMTISGSHSTIDNQNGTATSDNTGYELNFVFAF